MSQQMSENRPVVLGFLKYSFSGTPDKQIAHIVKTALESTTGNVYIDTAAAYGDNRNNEKIAGRVFNLVRDIRVKIITKFGISFDEKTPFQLSNMDIEESFTDSREALGRLPDVFMSHRIPKNMGRDDLIRIAKKLMQIKRFVNRMSIGMSEPSIEQLVIMKEYVPIDVIELSCGPFDARLDLRQYAKNNGIMVIGYGTCLRGILNVVPNINMNSFDESDTPAVSLLAELKKNGVNDFTLNVGFFQPENIVGNWYIIKQFMQDCGSYNPNNAAVQWSYDNGIIPIIETTSVDHLKNNLRIIDLANMSNKCYSLTGNPNPMMLAYLDC
jgi:aryl-alcohol dehydrogenase-like predicted oxidoreductase